MTGKRIYVLAPLVQNRKGHYKELFENLLQKGYLNVRIDGELAGTFPRAEAGSIPQPLCRAYRETG